jgi:hypothetical protein
MDTMLLELVNLVPELALAVIIVWFVMKRDDTWRTCFRDATQEYKQLAERLEGVILKNTEVIASLTSITEIRQELTRELVQQIKEAVRTTEK